MPKLGFFTVLGGGAMSPIGLLSGIIAMLRFEGSSSALLVGEGGETAKDNVGTGALLGGSVFVVGEVSDDD